MKHRSTDPACVYHRPPKGSLSRWRFDRARGKSCRVCARRMPVMAPPGGVGQYDENVVLILDCPGESDGAWRKRIGEPPAA